MPTVLQLARGAIRSRTVLAYLREPLAAMLRTGFHAERIDRLPEREDVQGRISLRRPATQ